MAFGPYQATATGTTTGTGSVVVNCTCTFLDCVAFGYSIAIDSGGSGSATSRKMTRTGGGGALSYQLYNDSLGLSPWTNASPQLYPLSLFGAGQTVFVYGRMAPGQSVKSGSYADGPMVTLSW